MKIGIVTFAWSKNYGAALQALALQVVLKKMGHHPFVIPINPEGNRSLIRRYLGKSVKETVRKIRLQKLFSRFNDFRARLYDYGGLKDNTYDYWLCNCPKADAFLAGSDQVWNLSVMRTPQEEDFYFLKMCPPNSIRLAYAASWSMKAISDDAAKRLKPILDQYNAIGVREKSGVDILSRMGIASEWTPDPTLLLDAAAWRTVLNFEKAVSKGVLSYKLGWDSALDCKTVASDLAQKMGCSVVCLYPDGDIMPSPSEWVAYIAGAKGVVTNSFHGTVFSLLFHRPFIVIPIIGRFDGMNERVFSLLERVGLSSRIVRDASVVQTTMLSDIDWRAVDDRMHKFRLVGLSFLEGVLGR